MSDRCPLRYLSLNVTAFLYILFLALALDDQIGNFVCGKEFDALIIDPEVPNSPMSMFEEDSVTDVVEKFLYTGKCQKDVEKYCAYCT